MIERLQTHWYDFIKLAIIYAMIFQISFIFDLLWFNRTYTMLAYMLVISFFIHILLSQYKKLVIIIVDFLLSFFICLQFSDAWEHYADQQLYTFIQKLMYTIADSWQLYLIGLSMLAFVHLINFAMQSRQQFSTFFAFSLILMLIVDSFSPTVLWKHVVVLIVLFLLWHMFWHYEQIRKSNEEEFEVLLYSPTSILAPFVTVMSIAIVVALIMPFGPPLLEDPYALWKKSRGEEVPAFLGDKGFKADKANTRGRQSGYSRSSANLGGGFNFNYETVLEISSPQKSYWRGETVNYYNGEGWVDTLRNDNYSEVFPNTPFLIERPLAITEEIQVQVNVLRAAPYPVLFHPSEPKLVSEVMYTFHNNNSLGVLDESHQYISGAGEKQHIIYNPAWSLPGVTLLDKDNTLNYDMPSHTISYPTTYSITADVVKLDAEKLVQTEAKLEDPVLHQLYTRLPDSLPQEVVDLAELITSQASSDYERAKLLEEHLKLNYAYSNQPNEERLSGQADDFVYQFLFELYEGYCDYFSTAMAVMAKSLDMPARWVKGFSSGVNISEQYLQQIPMSFDDYEQLQNSLSGGIFKVRNADAHSWVEIYFEGYGWIAFEPTPGFSYPYEYTSDDIQLNQYANIEQLDIEEENISSQKQSFNNKTWILAIVAAIACIVILVVILRNKDNVWNIIVRWRYKRFSNNERIVYQFNAFLRYCERRGLRREKTETAREAILNWQYGSKAWKQQLDELYQLFEKAKYSTKLMNDEEVREMNALIQTLKKQWKV